LSGDAALKIESSAISGLSARFLVATTRRLALTALALGLLPAAVPLRCRAQDEAPKLLSTTGGSGRQPWKNLAELQNAAAEGNPGACLQLGFRHETGDGVDQDYARARTLYEEAAAAGVADAIYRLGKLYQDGLGVGSDPAYARDLYEVAALAGVPLAQYNLGIMLVSARGGRRDYVEGLAWLILASRNHIEAEGEKQVREHLAKQPGVIAAAETRAKELERDVAARKGSKPPWPPPGLEPPSLLPAKPAPAAAKSVFSAPPIAPPKIEPPPPPALQPPTLPDTTRH
jgi:hypothetical protein